MGNLAGNTSVRLCPVPGGVGRRVLLLLLVVVMPSSTTTAVAPEHLLEEVELRRDGAQQGE